MSPETLSPGCINYFCKKCQRPVQLKAEGDYNKGTCEKCGTKFVSAKEYRLCRANVDVDKLVEAVKKSENG